MPLQEPSTQTSHADGQKSILAPAVSVIETSGLLWANEDGTVDCPPGEETVLVEFEPQSGTQELCIHAVGAADALNCEYTFRHNLADISFSSESPLGSLVDPYSFTKNLGHPLTTERGTAQYTVVNNGDTERQLAARMIIEEK